ncbi:multicopper oxidase family protein [Sphaerimonospora thailandensis]|uniref:Multicopper oxidase CueO n=1 Tax=Sphaerimonospora thailandensis TaxID=795644 RepID=A0A8J3R4Q1_9ACTN|nr:multicopper oxidase domain-containing protein [Sphaerimonospora thailandensis]GIH67791.1 multicopper oxidase [Sphaerimonospora thailandensis]
MLSRRRLLTLGGLAGGAMLLPGAGLSRANAGGTGGNHLHHHGAQRPPLARTPGVGPFSVRMPVPQELTPLISSSKLDVYQLTMRPANVEILPGVSTRALTYNGAFVGPTIRARSGRRTIVTFGNRLGEAANVHLHGGKVPASSDGYPMDVIHPGLARMYDYPNDQPGATLWYHDHSHHTEAEHVYRGLHGFYLLQSDDEQRLGLPSGQYDVPIMLRDALFDDSGALVFDPTDPFNRPTLLANGRPQPYFPVAARKYRLRLLNGSTHRVFELDLGGVEMTQIASDGGLLPEPVTTTNLTISSGERVEVVVDFSAHPVGSQLVLNDVSGPVLRFDVVQKAVDRSSVPDRLRALPPVPQATNTRQMTLSLDPVNIQALINGRPFDHTRVDAQIRRGTTEIWRITNSDTDVGGSGFGLPHNFHMHLVQFRVLDRDGRPPLPGESGLKDTVLIQPGESVRVQATFGDYLGRYLYHCHMLEHSALGMMGQFEIVR